MKSNEEILELTKGYKIINYLYSYMVSADGKNLFQYKGINMNSYEDNLKVGLYWVFFNASNKRAIVFLKQLDK